MIYIQYHECKNKYYDAQKDFEKVLSEKERLFTKTQPGAVDTTKEKTSGGTPSNTFDNYLVEKEKKNIDKRLKEVRSILEDREKLFNIKTELLKESKEWDDIIYAYRYIENLSIRKIERRIPFSKSEIYRKLQIIRKNIKSGQNGKKVGV